MAEPSAPLAPRRRHAVLRRLAIALVVLVAMLAAGLVLLHTRPVRRWVAAQALDVLRARQIAVTLDGLDYNLLDMRLSLGPLEVRGAAAGDLPPLVAADRIALDLSAWSLLAGRYVLDEGSADNLRVHYVVAADGRDNLPTRGDRQGGQAEVLIRDLQVRGGSVRYENRPLDLDAQLPLETMHVTGDPVTDRHRVVLSAGGGTYRQRERTLRLDALQATLDAGDDDARIEALSASGEGAELTAQGVVEQFADPRLRLDVDARADVARVAAAAAVAEPVAGRIALRGRVEGPLRTPGVSGHLEGEALRVRGLSGLQVRADAALAPGARRVDLRSLDVRAPEGHVAGSGVVALDGGESRAAVTADGLDVTQLLERLDVDVPVATTMEATVEARWPGREVARATGSATALLRPPSRVPPDRVAVGGRVDVAAPAGGGAITARLSGVRAPGVAVDGEIRLEERTRLDGRARVRLDLDRGLSTAERALQRPQGGLRPTPVTGTVDAAVDLGGTVDAPVVAAHVSAPAVRAGTAAPFAATGDVRYAARMLHLDAAHVTWQSATLAAAGTVGLDQGGALALTVDADGLQVPELLGAAGQGDVPAEGTLSLRGTVRGTRTAPAVNAAVQGRELVAYGERWGELRADAALAGRELAVSSFTLSKPQAEGTATITGRGAYHLDQRTLAADVAADGLRIEHVRLPDGRTLRTGEVQLTAHAEGSVEAPRGQLRLGAAAARLDARELGRVDLEADLDGVAADVRLTAPQFAATGTGRIGLQAPYPTTATVRVDGLALARLLEPSGAPLEGQLTATIAAAGPLSAPADGEAQIEIAALTGTWQDQPFQVAAPARLRYAQRRLAVEDLRLEATGATARVRGELPLEAAGAPGALEIEARADVAPLLAYAPPRFGLTGTGTLTAAGTVRGTLEAVDPQLVLTVVGGGLSTADAETGLSDLELRATVAGGRATLETLVGRVGDGRLSATGTVPLGLIAGLPLATPAAIEDGALTATLEALPLAGLPGVPRAVSGQLGLTATLTLPSADPKDVRGEVVVDTLSLAFDALTLAQQQPTRIALEAGEARLASTTLEGTAGRIAASGAVGLASGGALSGAIEGRLDLGAVAALAENVSAGGAAEISITAAGTTRDPELHGAVTVANAQFLVDEPTLAAENLKATLTLDGRLVTLPWLTGQLNGGDLEGWGYLELGGAGIASADVALSARNVVNDFPLDLRSVSTSYLTLTGRDGGLVLGGMVTIADAGLTGDINFDEGILAALSRRQRLDLTPTRNPLLETLEFDVGVRTTTPIVVENNLANAEVTADVRVLGTPYQPGLSGQLSVLEGGEITLNERRYEVERGIVSFLGEREILPSVDLGLRTTAQGYDITVTVSGQPGRTEATFTSDPALPEPDIMAVLVTGRTLDEMRGEEYDVAKEQVLSYLAGRVGSPLGRGLERATGLSSVRVQPELIANETNPGARLTVGQDITRRLELVYSVDLTNSNNQIWMANLEATRRFRTSVVRQEDNSVRLDVRHDVRLGGEAAPERQPRRRPRVVDVHVLSDGRLDDAEVLRLLDIDVGDEFQAIAARRATTNVLDELREDGRLEARVHLERWRREGGIALVVQVQAGPVVQFTFEGATPPGDVVDELRRQWGRGVFDAQRIDDVVERLQGWLMRDGYLQAEISARIDEPAPDRRHVVLTIVPGARTGRIAFAFDGAAAIPPEDLEAVLQEQDLTLQVLTDPIPVTELLERLYAEQGYLAARVALPRVEYAAGEARIAMRVTEGPRFVVGDVTVRGVTAMREDELLGQLPLVRGEPFLPVTAENALRQTRRLYWARGYNEVRPDYALVVHRAAGRVDVRFTVEEGMQSVVTEIGVEGNRETSDRLITGQIAVQPEQPLDLGKLATSRSELYGTGAFSLVDIIQDPLPSPDGQVQPVALTVSVREVQPWQLRYGVSADTERGVGGLADLSAHNLIGDARVLGVRGRYDRRIREGRFYFTQPSQRRWPVETTASLYYRTDRSPRETSTRRLDLDRMGLSIQQEKPLGNAYIASLGFRLERTRTLDPALVGSEERVTVAPLNATFTRDTRDDVLDAVRGSFTSHALQFSPTWLGSDDTFLTYFGQFSHYRPLQRPRIDPLTRDAIRPRFVFASSARIGLAYTAGAARLPRGERFFAGGSTTLRGVAQDALGPLGVGGLPLGGESLIVLNGELRFPLLGMVDGVTFLDVGNVYARLRDFALDDLRQTAGLGVRVRTPWFLGRGDLGFVLDPREGERRWRVFLGIGQAF